MEPGGLSPSKEVSLTAGGARPPFLGKVAPVWTRADCSGSSCW